MRNFFRLPVLFALGGLLLAAALAAAPPAGTQAPGFYRYAVGGFEVTALYDGYLFIDPARLGGIKPEVLAPLKARAFLENEKGAVTSVNAFLVNTGEHLILVDAGTAGCFGPTMGQVPQNLKAAGYKPEDVDTVLITHMHGDHVCGLVTAEGKPVYPNATVYAAEAEADFWLDEKIAAAAPKDRQGAFKLARDSLAPYIAKGSFRRFKPGALFPGVTAIDLAGHTPGHTGYLFTSQGRSFLAMGDIVHVHLVQFARPEAWMAFDSDHTLAVAARKALFAKLAANRWAIGGAHLPFPGIGHVRKEGGGYAYVPVDYSPVLPPG